MLKLPIFVQMCAEVTPVTGNQGGGKGVHEADHRFEGGHLIGFTAFLALFRKNGTGAALVTQIIELQVLTKVPLKRAGKCESLNLHLIVGQKANDVEPPVGRRILVLLTDGFAQIL